MKCMLEYMIRQYLIIFVKTCLQGGSRSTERTIEDLEVFWVTLREFS